MSEKRDIGSQLEEAMKAALKGRDKQTLQTIRMVRSAMQERVNQSAPPPEITNALWQEVIAAYVKKMQKAALEYAKIGERGVTKVAELEAEITLLKPYLPAMLEGDALKAIIQEAMSTTGAQNPADMGKLMGAVMKTHKGKVDPGQVKAVAMALLTN